jgi:hypothetical protein
VTSPPSRRDDLEQTQWMKLHKVYLYARRNKYSVIQSGDFTDSSRSWVLLRKLYNFFKKFEDVKTYFVNGQHDIYMRESTSFTILEVLIRVFPGSLIRLTREPLQLSESVRLYGIGYMDDLSPIRTNPKYINILAIHRPITIQKETVRYGADALAFVKNIGDFRCVLCGDIHYRFIYRYNLKKNIIVNSGPFLRKSITEKERPAFFVFDTLTLKCSIVYVSKVKNPFITSAKAKEMDYEYLNLFEEKLKKENISSYFNISSQDKVRLMLKTVKNNRVHTLIKEIINECE